ncbi:aspartate kinase [Candidatus Contubernalis alkaliaceticus]|uniref:aspartate kinase n=1 Tax=Candidatus Contubernalis alkaliaceticus TaxID=338645 RepID=UPI001F4C490E|nr:aspartate kinase [Candidatus Contubernalis alkalaceticus]UNC92937.1 aspartate kinase [Candidatus Contubernalis alkalaceticus]
MKIIVQKFGGTSVATPKHREMVVERVKEAIDQGFSPVVVVSAMGRLGEPYATDTLKNLALCVNPDTNLRELDMVMSCGEIISTVVMASTLQAKGIPARAMAGFQAGMHTDGEYAQAEVVKCKPHKIREALEKGEVVVVAGFQGISPDWEINTMGRGGSDTSAVILGAALDAEQVVIFTDVSGVMTADPKMLEDARIIDHLTYSEVCHMAYEGAKVIHPPAVEIAMQHNVSLVIRNPADPGSGTLINNEYSDHGGFHKRRRIITGIAHGHDLAQVKVKFLQNSSVSELDLFQQLAEAKISIDLITVFPEVKVFTVQQPVLPKAEKILTGLGVEYEVIKDCAKVSVVGVGMRNIPGVMAKVVRAFNDQDIKILQTGDSNITISLLINQEDLKKAIKTLHDHFELGKGHNFSAEVY